MLKRLIVESIKMEITHKNQCLNFSVLRIGFYLKQLYLQIKNYENMSDTPNAEEFYKNLKGQLEETTDWPSEYLYKFIVKSEANKISDIEALFDNSGAVITKNESKNKKYTSISINVVMKDPDAVIAKYVEVTNNVEGVISL